METVKAQSTFTRSLYNDAKAGAYYTDLSHTAMISNFLKFSEREEYCCLEPSIGDGKAIKSVIRKNEGDLKKIFGVELNPDTCKLLFNDSQLEGVLNTDFLNGVKISHSVFSFCFSNPPYGTDETGKNRLEKNFLEKLTDYLRTEAVLVYVVPASIFADENFLKCWCARFSTRGVYRFHEKEYEKFKQIVAFGVKKRSKGYFRDEYDSIYQSVKTAENIPLLPEHYDGEKIIVKPSLAQEIEFFSKKEFDQERARMFLEKSVLLPKMKKVIEQDEYSSGEINSPPIPLSESMNYLLSMTGVGEGLAGSEEDGDQHLQRGGVKVIETSFAEQAEGKDATILKVRSSSKAYMTIVESSGKITRLE